MSETVSIKRRPPPLSSLCASLRRHNLRINELQLQKDERRRGFAVKTQETRRRSRRKVTFTHAGILTNRHVGVHIRSLNCQSTTFSQDDSVSIKDDTFSSRFYTGLHFNSHFQHSKKSVNNKNTLQWSSDCILEHKACNKNNDLHYQMFLALNIYPFCLFKSALLTIGMY